MTILNICFKKWVPNIFVFQTEFYTEVHVLLCTEECVTVILLVFPHMLVVLQYVTMLKTLFKPPPALL